MIGFRILNDVIKGIIFRYFLVLFFFKLMLFFSKVGGKDD